MSKPPERLNISKALGGQWVAFDGNHGWDFIRLDIHEAAVAAARKEGMLEAAEFCHWNAVGLNPRLGYQVDPWTEEQGGKHPGHAYAKALRAKAEASK